MRLLRKSRGLSRGQIAKRLKTTPTIVYNVETGKSRIKLSVFFEIVVLCGFSPREIISKHLHSIQKLADLSPGDIVRVFRNRLKISQKELAKALGYSSASMIHHFESGIREPSLADFIKLMVLTGDNVRGLILELTGDTKLSEEFPIGEEAAHQNWQEYWSAFYIPAIRQLMRTSAYEKLARYEPGLFANLLGISVKDERHALEVLKRFNVIRWEKAKPVINPGTNVVVPKDIAKKTLDELKVQWVEFNKRHYLQNGAESNLFSVDLIPVNKKIVEDIVKRIRQLQDEIHNLPLTDTDGFISLGWLASYVAI